MLRFPESIRVDLIDLRKMIQALTQKAKPAQKDTYQNKLTGIRTAMENQTLQIAEGFYLYGQTVDDYYSQFHPFGTKDVEKDFEDFIELIGHSVVVGNYFLISEWGVKYPLDNPSVLAGEKFLKRYVDRFKKAIGEDWGKNQSQHRWPDEAREYWKYLIKEWEQRL